ncbi:FKBP-type peptidyl-prolyl cis-trans isomerase [Pokkaliibacter plantistimulans]|uniref:Peptidyl-prolyl cis-trans isomerase n=1 Tax=Proteobacteria bacterium 228 TaxID=2083153 RepID=A0A2S5KWN4_9PROT|nr:FKBP-type peptidyl-prolyl cis-trans isomerase [Pokkaliibacter plantistimulans]PPC79133.1 FKBP-type peptidyl-prolyl cis-trans isomerase [Pokkaliibacter plantistimulans]
MHTSDVVVESRARVTLHFSLTLVDGQIIDSNFDRPPASFVVGDGSLLEGFERKLLGLQAGQRETFVLSPEHAFGQWNPANLQYFKREQFPQEMVIEPGEVISFSDAINSELPGVVQAVDGDKVTVDFNHPLAGKDIHFTVHILQVEPAV